MLKDRLTRAIEENPELSQADLARSCKIKAPSVSDWFSGATKTLKGSNLLNAATYLGVSPQWLATGQGPMRPAIGQEFFSVAESSNENQPGYVRFQLLEGAGGMGDGAVNDDYPEVIREVNVAEWEVRRKLGFLPAPGRIRLITGRGPSMRPKIEDGDSVMVDTAFNYFDGDDYYLINVDGETQIKMLQKRSDGLYVVSANDDFPAYRVDLSTLHVAGKALVGIGFRRL